jgi:hypothetical protein
MTKPSRPTKPARPADLGLLLDELTANLARADALPDSLDERVGRLQRIAQEKLQERLLQPVADANDFAARLRYVNRMYKRGLLNRNLYGACLKLHEYMGEGSRLKPAYYKIHTLLYEINDSLREDARIIAWSKVEGEKLLADLRKYERQSATGGAPRKSRRLLREQVLFVTCYSNELKRAGDTDGALKVFTWLYHFTERHVRNDEVHCCATMGNLSHHLAALCRISEEHDAAEEMYLRALQHYYERASLRRGEEDDFYFVTRRIAMCIEGLGWVHLTRGAIRRAELALAAARALMVHISDRVVRASVNMMFGTIKRIRAGTSPGPLADAISLLTEAWREFEDIKNSRYVKRARWELALAYNVAGDFAEAEKHLDFVEGVYRDGTNLKWQANVHILRSRIRRNQGRHAASPGEALGRYRQALAEARAAYKLTKDGASLLLPELDALITRGEAYFQLAESTDQKACGYQEALDDFLLALDLLKPKVEGNDEAEPTRNPKIAAACALHAAACYVRMDNWTEADAYLKRWKRLRPLVEHQWLREKAAAVEEEFARMTEDFIVSARNPEDWDYKKKLHELRSWFRRQALKQTGGSMSRAAVLLKVERNALRYNRGKSAKAGKGGRKRKSDE